MSKHRSSSLEHVLNHTFDKLTQCMMTSSNGNIFRVTGPLCGEFTGPGEFPTQRPVTRSFYVFFDLRLNKQLNKQLWGWWFETLSRSLWRHCNGTPVRLIHSGLLTRQWVSIGLGLHMARKLSCHSACKHFEVFYMNQITAKLISRRIWLLCENR